MTAVRAFCIRMRCNLSAVSSLRSHLTVPGHSGGNDSVRFYSLSTLENCPAGHRAKGLSVACTRGAVQSSSTSRRHFVPPPTSPCLSLPLLFSGLLRIIWEEFSPWDYPQIDIRSPGCSSAKVLVQVQVRL